MIRAISLVLLALLLVAADSDPPGTEVIVAFTRTRFEPSTVEVGRGTRVTFHNMGADQAAYSIVASDGSFESHSLGPGREWTHRFLIVGEHEYFLKEHPETRGKAVVK